MENIESILGLVIFAFACWLIWVLCRPKYKSVRFCDVEPDTSLHHYRTIRTKIRGVTFRGAQGIIRRCCHPGDALTLRRESQNPKDRNAIQIRRLIYRDNGRAVGEQLGYVSRDLAADLAPAMDAGVWTIARITELTGGVTGWEGISVGVNIQIEVYKLAVVKAPKPPRSHLSANENAIRHVAG